MQIQNNESNLNSGWPDPASVIGQKPAAQVQGQTQKALSCDGYRPVAMGDKLMDKVGDSCRSALLFRVSLRILGFPQERWVLPQLLG